MPSLTRIVSKDWLEAKAAGLKFLFWALSLAIPTAIAVDPQASTQSLRAGLMSAGFDIAAVTVFGISVDLGDDGERGEGRGSRPGWTEPSAERGPWLVLIGDGAEAGFARIDRGRLAGLGLRAEMLRMDGQYFPVAVLARRAEAEKAKAVVNRAIRTGARVVAARAWCPQPTRREGYLDCS